MRVGCGLHGFGRRGSRQRGCRILQCVARIRKRVPGIFHGGQLAVFYALQFAGGRPRVAVFLRALKFQRRLERVLVLGNYVVAKVFGVMRHGRQDGQGKQQQHAGEPDAHEQRGEVAKGAQKHTQAEARGEAQALGQGISQVEQPAGASAAADAAPLGGNSFAAALRSGSLKAAVVVGGNPAFDLPGDSAAAEALQGLDCLVVMDRFMTETAELADFVLPLLDPLESSGEPFVVHGPRPVAAMRAAVADGPTVRLATAAGSVDVRAHATEHIHPCAAWLPAHFGSKAAAAGEAAGFGAAAMGLLPLEV